MPDSFSFPRFVKITALGIVLVCIGFYLLFQARFLVIGPEIELTNAPPTVNNERSIELSGTTFNIARLWLNDRPIFTDAQGNFREALILENGYTVTTLRAEDRYGRETRVTRTFVYTPSSFVQ